MKVIIFHTTNCAFCKTEMQWLDSKDVEYTHLNIDTDPIAMEEMVMMNITGVPVTVIDTKYDQFIVKGFDRKRLSSILGV